MATLETAPKRLVDRLRPCLHLGAVTFGARRSPAPPAISSTRSSRNSTTSPALACGFGFGSRGWQDRGSDLGAGGPHDHA